MGWENFLDRRNKMLLAPLIMLLTGCSVNTWYNPVSPPPSRVSSADMSNRSEEFRRGHKDGCRTAHGEYTKDSESFRNEQEYHDGWFAGRSACQYH
jgi:hypothetical protein